MSEPTCWRCGRTADDHLEVQHDFQGEPPDAAPRDLWCLCLIAQQLDPDCPWHGLQQQVPEGVSGPEQGAAGGLKMAVDDMLKAWRAYAAATDAAEDDAYAELLRCVGALAALRSAPPGE